MKKFKSFKNKLYLSLSDCDGMCNHCGDKLKTACEKLKKGTI